MKPQQEEEGKRGREWEEQRWMLGADGAGGGVEKTGRAERAHSKNMGAKKLKDVDITYLNCFQKKIESLAYYITTKKIE